MKKSTRPFMYSSLVFVSMPSAPWPMAGRLSSTDKSSVIFSAQPSLLTPAPARMYGVEVAVLELFHAGVEVAPQLEYLEVGAYGEELGLASRRLDVPIFAPLGRSRSFTWPRLKTASLGSSLSVMHRRLRPSGK